MVWPITCNSCLVDGMWRTLWSIRPDAPLGISGLAACYIQMLRLGWIGFKDALGSRGTGETSSWQLFAASLTLSLPGSRIRPSAQFLSRALVFRNMTAIALPVPALAHWAAAFRVQQLAPT